MGNLQKFKRRSEGTAVLAILFDCALLVFDVEVVVKSVKQFIRKTVNLNLIFHPAVFLLFFILSLFV